MSALAKETLDRLSGALLQDEQTLSSQEKELLTNLLQAAQQQTGRDHDALVQAIYQAVGETLARRAYGALGRIIVQRVAAQAVHDTRGGASVDQDTVYMPPRPPAPVPPSPGPGMSLTMPPKPPAPIPPAPGPGMSLSMAPQPPATMSPSPGLRLGRTRTAVDLTARQLQAEILPANWVALDEFLSPSELADLMAYALAHESDFQISEVVSPGLKSAVDFNYRRSRVLMEMGKFQRLIEDKLLAALPGVLPRLHCRPFPASKVEMQITASGDGEFFRCHSDNSHEEISSRQITFVYFFHHEPKAFQGGELKLYDSQWQEVGYGALQSSHALVPQQNQLVMFISSLMHEVAPVQCPGGRFADMRFTVNGWLHR